MRSLPFASDLDLQREQVDVGEIDAPQFGQAESTRIEELDHGGVAHVGEASGPARAWRRAVMSVSACSSSRYAGSVREIARRTHGARGVHVHALVAMHPAIERAHGGDATCQRSLGEAGALTVCEPATQILSRERRPRPSFNATRAPQPRAQRREIAPIRDQRVGREVAFLLEMFEKLLDIRWQAHRVRGRRLVVHAQMPEGAEPAVGAARTSVSERSGASCTTTGVDPMLRHPRVERLQRTRRETSHASIRLSRSGRSRSSSSPKFAFIGWKCLGSASRM